jgi:hypothetical protein
MTIPLLVLLAFADLPKSPKRFFDSSKIWTVHVTLSADAYKNMEPAGGPCGLGGLRGPGMPAPGDNIARAFSLVGALSLVRFRTVVRDTKDTAYVIVAVIGGLSAGAETSRLPPQA